VKRIRYLKLTVSIGYVLFGFIMILYFSIVGFLGVTVLSRHIMEKFGQSFGPDNSDIKVITVFLIAALFGMIPFGLVAIYCLKPWMKKLNVSTIEDALK